MDRVQLVHIGNKHLGAIAIMLVDNTKKVVFSTVVVW